MERALYPFKIITMDFTEFEKKGESFIFSGAMHIAGVSKRGTSMETIAEIVTFAGSNVRNIQKNHIQQRNTVHIREINRMGNENEH